MQTANWSYPTEIRFGCGRLKEILEICEKYRVKRPLFVTDRKLLSFPQTEEAIRLINKRYDGDVFSEVDPNPTEKNLQNGIKAFKIRNHDSIIAFGGGSAIDLGKLIAFMVGQKRPVWEFEDIEDWWTKASSRNIKPIIVVPTTSGTGSEVGRAAVLTNSTVKVKKIIFHPKMLATAVIIDPNLTVSLPPEITAGTGLDAFAHCLEAYCSPHFHPMSNGIALEGLKIIKDNLIKVYNDGTDLVSRGNMMVASMMGAVAFQKGLGAIHALSHPIGAIYNSHHGVTNAVLAPYVVRFNENKIKEKIEDLSYYLKIDGGFDGFVSFIEKLNTEFKIPQTLRELGVRKDDFKAIVEGALNDPSRLGNPLELNFHNTMSLLETAY